MLRAFLTSKWYWNHLPLRAKIYLVIDCVCWFTLAFVLTYLAQ